MPKIAYALIGEDSTQKLPSQVLKLLHFLWSSFTCNTPPVSSNFIAQDIMAVRRYWLPLAWMRERNAAGIVDKRYTPALQD